MLSAPGCVETFSEELTVPGPRLPVTRDAALFTRAVALGRRLLFLHTYGERFVPEGGKRGQIPSGAAKCVKGIPTSPDKYPEEFSWEESGSGDMPVAVRKARSAKSNSNAGANAEPRRLAKEVCAPGWTAALTTELLELLWVLEATVAAQPELDALLSEILAAPLFAAADFPAPTAVERAAPGEQQEEMQTKLKM